MGGRNIGELGSSTRGRYIRSTSDITSKWYDIRTGSDINELYESSGSGNLTIKFANPNLVGRRYNDQFSKNLLLA